MKKITSIIFLLCALFWCPAIAQDTVKVTTPTISLLTCTAGDEIWSEYGHTALRVRGLGGQDVVFNYGVFDSSQKNFILRFVFGLTDYRVEMMPFVYFLMEYKEQGRGVTEQVLNLTEQETNSIVTALLENILPENRVYRYNFFYDNCTTRPRDIILENLQDTVKILPSANSKFQNLSLKPQSYRSLIHERNELSPWNRYGEDLLLGVEADQAITQKQAEFLPDILMHCFERARVGEKPLVRENIQLLAPHEKEINSSLFTPSFMSYALLTICLFALIWESRCKRVLRWLDLTLLLAAGAVGVILTAMLFSQHPTVRVNLLLLIFNPLPLVMLCVTIYNMVRARGAISRWWWWAWWWLILLGAIGGIFQGYPEGMSILALSLLVRCMSNLIVSPRENFLRIIRKTSNSPKSNSKQWHT